MAVACPVVASLCSRHLSWRTERGHGAMDIHFDLLTDGVSLLQTTKM
jgi:hypothetical protein